MRIKKTYTEFIKESSEFIDEKTIKEVFIDLIDMDFTLEVVNSNYGDKGANYFIDIKKSVDSKYDYIENNFSYGVSNLEPMKLDITKVLDILQSAKETLMSMEYTVGYEIEFNFNDQVSFLFPVIFNTMILSIIKIIWLIMIDYMMKNQEEMMNTKK